MRTRFFLLLIIPLLVNCPKKYKPDIESIEVLYIASLHEDIYRDLPILSGIKGLPGLKVGHLRTEPAFLGMILGRLGFYELLNSTGIDFVIADSVSYWIDNISYFLIPRKMGYAIKNLEGIRFAILRKHKDMLTIDDEIQIALVKQRSDVLWIVDNRLLDIEPVKINFFIKDRGLSDTTIAEFGIKPDSIIFRKIKNFTNLLDQALNKKTYLQAKTLKEYILSTIAQNQGVDLILYPEELFIEDYSGDSVSLQDILNSIVGEMKFTKKTLDKMQIENLIIDKKYQVWGEVKDKTNLVLPDTNGYYIFDMFYKL